MSQENVELVRDAVEAWNRADRSPLKNEGQCTKYAARRGHPAGVNTIAAPAVGGEFTGTCSGFGLQPSSSFKCGAQYGDRFTTGFTAFLVAADGTLVQPYPLVLECTFRNEGVKRVSALFVDALTAEGIEFRREFPPPSGC